MCSTMPRSRFAVVEDQEQVDKIMSVAGAAAEARAHASTTSRAACATTITRRLQCDRRRASQIGRETLAARARRCRAAGSIARSTAAQGLRPLDHSLHVGHDRPLQGRGADRRSAVIMLPPTTVDIRQAHRQATRRSPICRSPGSATIYLNYAQSLCRRLLRRLSGSGRDRHAGSREIGTDLLLSRRRACSRTC